MNNQEAIKVLSNFDMQVSAKADGAYQSAMGKMACDRAIWALEKQIAKKPVKHDNCENKCASYRCPNCFELVSGKYCEECGQHLKWEESENGN